MPGMIYPFGAPAASTAIGMYPTSSIICPTVPVLSVPVVAPLAPTANSPQSCRNHVQQSNVNLVSNCSQTADGKNSMQQSQTQRPASQATSVKAEPGSTAMGSIASASLANKVICDNSKQCYSEIYV